MRSAGICNIVCALFAEARPLIEHFRMREDADAAPFRVFAGDSVRLVVSGIGRLQSAAACGYLHALGGAAKDQAWLNVGIAGHATLPTGTVCLVDSIRLESPHAGTEAWYPQWTGKPIAVGVPLLTVDAPATELDDRFLYDMEAAGFVATCNRFSTSEFVHALKVVSDSGGDSLESVRPAMVSELIGGGVATVAAAVGDLVEVASAQQLRVGPPAGIDELTQQFRMSVTQRRELERLLRSWHALESTDGAGELARVAENANDVRELLSRLRAATEGAPF